MKQIMAVAVMLLLLTAALSSSLSHSSALTLPVIRILPDGNIDPPNVPIQRSGDLYMFTDNIYARIVVDRDNLVIDGAGYTLHGNYNGTRTDSWVVGQGPNQEYNETAIPWSIGIDLANKNRHNLTVMNLNIKNFYIGIYVWTTNNTITNCAVTDCIVGILLSGDSNNITENYIARNEQGVFFGVNQPGNEPLNIMLTHNSFIDNMVHFSGCFCEEYNPNEPIHTWDNGEEGNYWSDYNGTDADGDGIGDTPYIIDPQNQDRYPLMRGVAEPPTPTSGMPIATIIAGAVIAVITVTAIVGYRRKRNSN
ncbi:MAG: NosD domain-containing protein [Candidatus Bathyarchaeia archaeon]